LAVVKSDSEDGTQFYKLVQTRPVSEWLAPDCHKYVKHVQTNILKFMKTQPIILT